MDVLLGQYMSQLSTCLQCVLEVILDILFEKLLSHRVIQVQLPTSSFMHVLLYVISLVATYRVESLVEYSI